MRPGDLFAFFVVGSIFLMGCGEKVNFSSLSSESRMSVPVVTTPVDITPSMSLKSGACSVSGEQVLSCLSCNSTLPVTPPPLLSRKAEELLSIMTAGCSVPNKSDPVGYIAPTREQLLKRLIQCSPADYPDTAFMGTQGGSIQSLLSDPAAQQSAFGKLYYNSFSTDFETYFGLEIGEARNVFCRGQSSFNSAGVYPKEYYDALYNGSYYTLPVIYQKAQVIRQNLRSCLEQSLINPSRNQAPAIPGKTCSFEYAEGEMSSRIVDKVDEWQRAGLQVYFEGQGQCGAMMNPRGHLDRGGIMRVAVKRCR